MSERKFYRYRYAIDILSELRLPEPMSLEAMRYHITEGDCSGTVVLTSTTELDGPAAVALLREHGAYDPEFFGLNPDGSDMPWVETRRPLNNPRTPDESISSM